MRTIKFRAWNGRNMYSPIIDEYGNIYESEFDFTERNHSNKHQLMQFTGFLDKNGVEIYEGDICICDNLYNRNNPTVIKWDKIVNVGFRLSKYWTDQYEVIGNIYENTKL